MRLLLALLMINFEYANKEKNLFNIVLNYIIRPIL